MRRTTGRARQFFHDALDRRLISENPFVGLPAAVHANADRFEFLTRSQIEKVIAACPDVTWQLVFALSRYGGLRVESEEVLLKWSDIRWDERRMVVTSPKTAHHVGKDKRVVPIFPEFLPFLQAAREEAPEGAVYVLHRYGGKRRKLGTQAERIVKRFRGNLGAVSSRTAVQAGRPNLKNAFRCRRSALGLATARRWPGNTASKLQTNTSRTPRAALALQIRCTLWML